jgi:DNA modification methylase
MDCIRRIPNPNNWPLEWVNKIIHDDALHALQQIPDECVALVVTSPPYWNIVDYGIEGQIGQTDYDRYLRDLLPIWEETKRILIPNGKLAIVTPIMPIPKRVMGNQHTRHLKNISNDIEQSILSNIKGLERYSLFVWQKQTSEKMFGSYPYPPNIYEDNTIEFINVFVKDGVPPTLPPEAKEASKMTQEEWRNLTMQVWAIYPEDVKRAGGHPCPFPVVLPQRLIKMYTFKSVPEIKFDGDIVLDMFNGTGATCVAARAMGRNWIGIDLHPGYCDTARHRVKWEVVDPDAIILEPVRVRGAKNSKQLQLFSAGASPDG